MNYSVTGEQLTSIADAIRAKQSFPSGKNLYNSENHLALVEPNKTYTFSSYINFPLLSDTWQIAYMFLNNKKENISGGSYQQSSGFDYFQPGTYSTTITTPNDENVKYVFINTILPDKSKYTNVMVEEGNTATTYEAFSPRGIKFAEEFSSMITDEPTVNELKMQSYVGSYTLTSDVSLSAGQKTGRGIKITIPGALNTEQCILSPISVSSSAVPNKVYLYAICDASFGLGAGGSAISFYFVNATGSAVTIPSGTTLLYTVHYYTVNRSE